MASMEARRLPRAWFCRVPGLAGLALGLALHPSAAPIDLRRALSLNDIDMRCSMDRRFL